MKKLLAILLSAVLLFTSVLSASMFTVSAEDAVEPLTDTVVLPKFKDADGYEINLPNTTEKVPGSIAVHPNISVVKNTSKLPFQSLFSVYAN
ncbi:MAG: hypothetical protein J6V50_02810, partial [Clostridia bacterium]|nr:hypothetical protein [Clostridia bacterium]